MFFSFLCAETLVIKGAAKPCHVLLKSHNLPEAFHDIEKTIHEDLDTSLRFDTRYSSEPYLYTIDLKCQHITGSECDITVSIHDNATKELRHTCHIKATTKKNNWRTLSHTISNFIFEKIQGMKGPFCTKIAFVKRSPAESIKSRVFICDYDGQNQKLLFENKNIVMGLHFSKDGKYLIYRTLHPRAGQRVWIYDLRKEQSIDVSALLTQGIGRDILGKNISALSFGTSPDELIFARSHRGSTTLHSYHLKTKKLLSITHPQRYIIQTCPVKSPDGQALFFSADTLGRENIYCIKNNGAAQRLPSNETLDYSQPILCENRLFFSARGKGYAGIFYVDRNNDDFENTHPIPIVAMYRPHFVEKPTPLSPGFICYIADKSVRVVDTKGNEILKYNGAPLLSHLGNGIADISAFIG